MSLSPQNDKRRNYRITPLNYNWGTVAVVNIMFVGKAKTKDLIFTIRETNRTYQHYYHNKNTKPDLPALYSQQ